MTLAYIGLGANLDEPSRQLQSALQELGALPSTRLRSYDLTTECIHLLVDLFQPIRIFVHRLPPFGGQCAKKNIPWHKILLSSY